HAFSNNPFLQGDIQQSGALATDVPFLPYFVVYRNPYTDRSPYDCPDFSEDLPAYRSDFTGTNFTRVLDRAHNCSRRRGSFFSSADHVRGHCLSPVYRPGCPYSRSFWRDLCCQLDWETHLTATG